MSNKIVITEKEIEQLRRIHSFESIFTGEGINLLMVYSFKYALDKYNKEDYKEVFVYDTIMFVYDIYRGKWFKTNNHKVQLSDNETVIKEGFYNYSIIKEAIPLFKNLDKDKIYLHLYIEEFLIYNKELMAWERIDNMNNKEIALKTFCIDFHNPITKEKFNRYLLIKELVS